MGGRHSTQTEATAKPAAAAEIPSAANNPRDLEIAEPAPSPSESRCCGSCIAVYRISFETESRKLDRLPVIVVFFGVLAFLFFQLFIGRLCHYLVPGSTIGEVFLYLVVGAGFLALACCFLPRGSFDRLLKQRRDQKTKTASSDSPALPAAQLPALPPPPPPPQPQPPQPTAPPAPAIRASQHDRAPPITPPTLYTAGLPKTNMRSLLFVED